jgi:hypothetical protein
MTKPSQISPELLANVTGGADDGPETIKPLPITEQPGPAFPDFGIMGSGPRSAYPGYPDIGQKPAGED